MTAALGRYRRRLRALPQAFPIDGASFGVFRSMVMVGPGAGLRGAAHQRGGSSVEGDLLVQQGGDHFSDRHFDVVDLRQGQDCLGGR
ncbi:hypothetical protein [Streptomyces sp. NPDC096934]|uniref:hypothetical protein n=1 Tax=Streptomyces sp. NPDC096934 TaxID=3155551 RepID=UPI003321428D